MSRRGVYLIVLNDADDRDEVMDEVRGRWGEKSILELSDTILLLSNQYEKNSVYELIAEDLGHDFDAIIFRLSGYQGYWDVAVWDWLDENE